MALNGSVSTNQYDGKVGLTCTWTATQDLIANKSILTWTLASDGSQYYTYETGNVRLDIGGETVLQIGSRFNMTGGGHWSRTGTLELPHNADGTKSFTINISAGIWYYTSSNCTGSGTFTLNQIPRESSATVPNFTVGTAGTVSISRASPDFTHRLSVHLGDAVYEIASGVGTSFVWTPDPAVWGPRIPNAASAWCAMIVDTYHGGTYIGRTAYNFTLYVPAGYSPTVSSLTVSPVNDNAVVKGWGVAVKGYTKLQWSASAEGAYGSSVTGWVFSAGGLTGTGKSGTTGVLQTAGSVTPSVRITDSRGRTASKTAAAITVYDCAAPNISNAAAYRCDGSGNADEAGTNVRITLTAHISSVGGKNSAKLQYRYRQAGDSYTDWTDFASGEILSGFDTAKSYELELRAVDSLGQNKTAAFFIPTESVWLSGRDRGNGAAFGKYAEADNLFDVAWNSRFRGEVSFDTIPAQLAPSGYGLGGGGVYPSSLGLSNANIARGGFYRWDSAGTSDGFPFQYGSMLVSPRTKDSSSFQLAFCHAGTYQGVIAARQYSSTSNNAWEYLNPPMVSGVEYRTTERYAGKPVYIRQIYFGTLPNTGNKGVSLGTGVDVISIEGEAYNSQYVCPLGNCGAVKEVWHQLNDGKIYISVNDGASIYEAILIVKYVKA